MTTALERMGREQILHRIADLTDSVACLKRRIAQLESGKEYRLMAENLAAVQNRCTSLLDENRGWRSAFGACGDVLGSIVQEVWRANAKFGTPEQLAHTRPDGIGSADQVAYVVLAKDRCDRAMANGGAPWSLVLDEENAECGATKSEEELKPELRQVAATAIRWHLAIDARGAR